MKSYDDLYGATLMGFDGVTLSKYFNKVLPFSPDVFEAFVAEFGPLVKSFYEKAKEMDLGQTQNINASMETVHISFKAINNNYFLAIVSNKDAFPGKVEYFASLEVKKLKKAFDI